MPVHLDVPHLLGILALLLATARLAGTLAQRVGQPAVLGELLAGVLLGVSGLGLVDPHDAPLRFMAELGVVLLLFEIGLETDLAKLLHVGLTSLTVAVVGAALPFALGYAVCRLMGLTSLVSIVAGATLTATSVGITARVLSELGRLQEHESQIILGAAVIDDVIGLVTLAIVAALTHGREITALGVVRITALAVGFIIVALLLGRWLLRPLVGCILRGSSSAAVTVTAVVVALGLAWLATVSGSEMIIGALVAGLVLRETPQVRDIQRGVAQLGHFFVPIFFVIVGAAVDLQALNPADSDDRWTLYVAGLLLVAAVIGKFAAAYAPFWFRGNKRMIGIGMIPRGEVGLIFAQMGLAREVFNLGMYSAVALVVMITTFLVPPLLKLTTSPGKTPRQPDEQEEVESLVMEP